MPRDRPVVEPSSFSPEARRWLKRGLIAGSALFLLFLGLCLVPARIREAVYRKDMERADEYARRGPVEFAIAGYQHVEAECPGSSMAERASQERNRLEAYVKAAGETKHKADAAFKNGEYEEALKLYRSAADRFPLSQRGASALDEIPGCLKLTCDQLNGRASAAASTKQWSRAKDLYGKILALDPNYADAAKGLRTASEEVKEFDRLMGEAAAAEKAPDWPKARADYEQALRIIPNAPSAVEGRTRALQNIPPPAGMALIPPGEFAVGEDESKPDASPLRKLTTNSFYMDITEVTNAQYAKFVEETSRKPPPHWDAEKPAHGQGRPGPPAKIADQPVVCIAWTDAAAYAAWARKRLPTEMEWERAARGRDGRKYPWGDSFIGNEGVFVRGAAPVGQMPADKSEEGCLDMGGNVSEWAADQVPEPPAVPERKREPVPGPTQPVLPPVVWRAVRGASWAGLERDRPDRIVPEDLANPGTNPTRAVLFHKPGLFGIEAGAFIEAAFFFRGVANDSAVIEVYRWFPDLRKVISGNVAILPGQEIAGARVIPSGPHPDSATLAVSLGTGCRLVSILDGGDPLKARIVYADAGGRQHTMMLSQRHESDIPRTPHFAPNSDAARAFDNIIRELCWRPFAETVRSANRLCAPQEARYINVGFRCAKDP